MGLDKQCFYFGTVTGMKVAQQSGTFGLTPFIKYIFVSLEKALWINTMAQKKTLRHELGSRSGLLHNPRHLAVGQERVGVLTGLVSRAHRHLAAGQERDGVLTGLAT